jgi:hypothetical protein
MCSILFVSIDTICGAEDLSVVLFWPKKSMLGVGTFLLLTGSASSHLSYAEQMHNLIKESIDI